MNNIRTRGNKYQAQVRMSGGRSASATFETRREAEEWLREKLYELSKLPKDRDERITLKEVIERFIKDTIPLRSSGANEAIRLRSLLREPIANLRLTQISRSDISAYRDKRLREVKRNTLVRDFGLIRTVVSTAVNDWGIKSDNPFNSFTIRREPDYRQRRISDDELAKLASTVCGNPYLKPAIILALETSMRLGELLQLTWHKIDMDKGLAELPRTKNGHARIVPLTPKAIETLQQIEGEGMEVFPVKPDTLKQSWRRLVKRAGIHDLRFHDLRHEAISRLLEMGLTIPEAASVSGHRTASMLARYAHPDPVKVREKMLK